MKHHFNDIVEASKEVQCTNYFEFILFSLILAGEMNADADKDDRIRKVIQHQRQINVQA